MRGITVAILIAAAEGFNGIHLSKHWTSSSTARMTSSVPGHRITSSFIGPLRSMTSLSEVETDEATEEAEPAAPLPPPGAVPGIDGTVLISGLLESSERTDQFMFDCLHKHDLFEKVVAYSPDVSQGKKKLLSRSARYTGLLNVLDFAEGSLDDLCTDGAPSLEGVSAWVAFELPGDKVEAAAAAAKAAGVKHFVALCTEEESVDFGPAAKVLEGSDTVYTFLQTSGALDSASKEGGPVEIVTLNQGDTFTAPATGTFGREDATRIVAEALLLPPAKNKVFGLSTGENATMASEYLRELRSKGYTRTQEVGFLMSGAYQEFAENRTAEIAKAKAEAEEAARPKTAEEIEAQKKSEEEMARDAHEKLADEIAANKERNIKEYAEKTCKEHFVNQRFPAEGATKTATGIPFYRRSPEEEPDKGIGLYDYYRQLNYDSIEQWVRDNLEWVGVWKDEVQILSEEDRERNKAIDASRKAKRKKKREEERQEAIEKLRAQDEESFASYLEEYKDEMMIEADYEVVGFEGTVYPPGSKFILDARLLPEEEKGNPNRLPNMNDDGENEFEWLVISENGKELVGNFDEQALKIVPYTGKLNLDDFLYINQLDDELFDPEDFEPNPEGLAEATKDEDKVADVAEKEE